MSGGRIRDALSKGLTTVSQREGTCWMCGGSMSPGVWIHRPYGSWSWVHMGCAAQDALEGLD